MTITFLGHACFLIAGSDGARITIDPYESGAFGGAIGYGPVDEAADVVLVSHEHADHNFVRGVLGSPHVCREACVASGIDFQGVRCAHDADGGSKRGEVTAFVFELDGIRVCHMGDLGAPLDAAQVDELGRVDVLMVPVGGTYTLTAEQAWGVVEQLKPRIVIPMHYQTAKTKLPLAPLQGFIAGRPGVVRRGVSSVKLSAADLGEGVQVMVLEPAR